MISAVFNRFLTHANVRQERSATRPLRRRRRLQRASRRRIRHVHAAVLAAIFSQTRSYHRYGIQPITLVILFPIGELYRETGSHETPDFWIVYGETADGGRQTIIECASEALASRLAQVFTDLWSSQEPAWHA